jgi:hypothetical protein
MTGEFCLMRGVNEGCLLSLAELPGQSCSIKATTDHGPISIDCPIESLATIETGGSAHLAGPEGLCAIERGRQSVVFRFLSSDRRARSYEIESTRFDAAVAMLTAGLSFASLT